MGWDIPGSMYKISGEFLELVGVEIAGSMCSKLEKIMVPMIFGGGCVSWSFLFPCIVVVECQCPNLGVEWTGEIPGLMCPENLASPLVLLLIDSRSLGGWEVWSMIPPEIELYLWNHPSYFFQLTCCIGC